MFLFSGFSRYLKLTSYMVLFGRLGDSQEKTQATSISVSKNSFCPSLSEYTLRNSMEMVALYKETLADEASL